MMAQLEIYYLSLIIWLLLMFVSVISFFGMLLITYFVGVFGVSYKLSDIVLRKYRRSTMRKETVRERETYLNDSKGEE